MQPKLLSTFDKFLLGGLGCGVIVLCVIAAWIFYIGQSLTTPLQSQPTVAPALISSPTHLTINIDPTPVSPTPSLTLEAVPQVTSIPSPLPGFFGDTPPTGKIVFVCYVKKIDQICLMDADGTNREQLTNFEATAFYPSLSLNEETIYFSSKQNSGFELYSMDINGKNQQRLTKNIGSLYAPELSPNGEWIVFTNNGNGLWLMRPDGKNAHRISDRDDIDPNWSPDGSMIAFASSRAGARQLFIMNADGSNIRQVTNLDNMGGRSTWSPDGTKLAFYRGPAGNHDIYIINVDGTGLVQLTNGGDNLAPSWSPDGNWIAFTTYRDGNNEIYIMHPDGTGAVRLTNNPISDWQPRWGR